MFSIIYSLIPAYCCLIFGFEECLSWGTHSTQYFKGINYPCLEASDSLDYFVLIEYNEQFGTLPLTWIKNLR